MKFFRINIKVGDGRYLSSLNEFRTINYKMDMLSPVQLTRYGGDEYSADPYLNLLKFQIVGIDLNNQCFEIKEFIDDFNPTIQIQRNTETVFFIPFAKLCGSIEFYKKNEKNQLIC